MQWWERMVSLNGRVKQDFYMQMIVCLMANSEEDMKVIMEKVNECVVEYGLKVNENKSKVVVVVACHDQVRCQIIQSS